MSGAIQDSDQKQLELTTQRPPRSFHTTRQGCEALVTGANGFIGRNLATQLLREGRRVRLFVRRPKTVDDLRAQGAEVVSGSLLDAGDMARAVAGVEQVFHLAGMTSAFSAKDLQRVNRDGSRTLAQACAAQSNPPVLVQVSSIAAAGPAKRGQVRIETDVPSPVSHYGRSKLGGELAVASFAGQLPVTIVRPGIVFGPHNREMLPMFSSIKWFNTHPIVGWRTPPISLQHVDDTVELLLRAAQHGSRLPRGDAEDQSRLTTGRGVYFATSPEFPTYAELGGLISEVLRRPYAAYFPLLGPAPWIAAGVNEVFARLRGRPDSFNIDKIREARVESWACSGDLARRELKLEPTARVREQLQATADWYVRERWL